jgi:hypothetical protein
MYSVPKYGGSSGISGGVGTLGSYGNVPPSGGGNGQGEDISGRNKF